MKFKKIIENYLQSPSFVQLPNKWQSIWGHVNVHCTMEENIHLHVSKVFSSLFSNCMAKRKITKACSLMCINDKTAIISFLCTGHTNEIQTSKKEMRIKLVQLRK